MRWWAVGGGQALQVSFWLFPAWLLWSSPEGGMIRAALDNCQLFFSHAALCLSPVTVCDGLLRHQQRMRWAARQEKATFVPVCVWFVHMSRMARKAMTHRYIPFKNEATQAGVKLWNVFITCEVNQTETYLPPVRKIKLWNVFTTYEVNQTVKHIYHLWASLAYRM